MESFYFQVLKDFGLDGCLHGIKGFNFKSKKDINFKPSRTSSWKRVSISSLWRSSTYGRTNASISSLGRLFRGEGFKFKSMVACFMSQTSISSLLVENLVDLGLFIVKTLEDLFVETLVDLLEILAFFFLENLSLEERKEKASILSLLNTS